MTHTHEHDPNADMSSVIPAGATFTIRATDDSDKEWIIRSLHRYWASPVIYSKGRTVDASALPGFAAFQNDEAIGLVTYQVEEGQCEIVTHNSMAGAGGIGSCLLAAVRQHARAEGCSRIWLITTNDNTPALRFYQRRDFDLVALYRGSVTEGRKLKPEIPDLGMDGIRLKHEIEMELVL